jgi:hypothetical protein
MSSLKIYGHPYRAADASIKQPTITVAAKHPFQHYHGYATLELHVSVTKRQSYWRSEFPQANPSVEWLLRFRRMVLFIDTCNLAVQIISDTKKIEEILRALRHQCNLDHTTILIGPTGSVFILNEPYYRVDNEDEALKSLGLVSIEIPISLSPYCGKWDDKNGSQPGTRSFLITDEINAYELNQIALRLKVAAHKALAWNDTRKIIYLDYSDTGKLCQPTAGCHAPRTRFLMRSK